MQKYQEFIQEIETVIKEIEQELNRRIKGIPGDGNVGQLELAINELHTIKDNILNNKLPPKGMRQLEISWYITDSWNDNSILGNKILKLTRKYKELD